MEFAAVNSPKSAAKTVAITLTNDEARNPANAFSALLSLGGNVRFKAESGLTKAESQWLRTQTQRDPEPTAKTKADLDGAFGSEQTPLDVDSIADLQRLPGLLCNRGYTEADVAGIMHGNFLRFLGASLK